MPIRCPLIALILCALALPALSQETRAVEVELLTTH